MPETKRPVGRPRKGEENKILLLNQLDNAKSMAKAITHQVCEKIINLAGDYFALTYCEDCDEPHEDIILTGNDLTEILDQIEAGVDESK